MGTPPGGVMIEVEHSPRVFIDGRKCWTVINSEWDPLHRVWGPAIINSDGEKSWYMCNSLIRRQKAL